MSVTYELRVWTNDQPGAAFWSFDDYAAAWRAFTDFFVRHQMAQIRLSVDLRRCPVPFPAARVEDRSTRVLTWGTPIVADPSVTLPLVSIFPDQPALTEDEWKAAHPGQGHPAWGAA